MVSRGISPDWPYWYHPTSPVGSAVRYLAGLSSKFHRVSLTIGSQKKVLGPTIKKTAVESEWSQAIVDSQGKKKGKISIQSRLVEAFTDADKRSIEKVASELGVLWRR